MNPRQTTSASFDRANSVEAFLLIKLGEECAEVIHACAKILEHGFNATNPDQPGGPDNKTQLAKELGDVLAVMHVLCERIHVSFRTGGLNHYNIDEQARLKRLVLHKLVTQRPKGKSWE